MSDIEELFKNEGYLLEESLGVDSWGEVYRAQYLPHRGEVLLRVFPGGLAEHHEAWELACAEIQAWGRLDHPGIIQVLDWGRVENERYLATVLPGGRPLGAVLNDEGGAEEYQDVFQNLLRSVEAARQWGVLHLGLGLLNIWVGDDGSVMTGEFGLWYVTGEFPELLHVDNLFLAPEQLSGGRASAATDVYALGLIYLALRFGLRTAAEVKQGSPLPDMPGENNRIFMRCLDREPLARYRTAGELAQAFQFPVTEWAYDEYRDCPLCRLKDQLHAEHRLGAGHERKSCYDSRGLGYTWLAIVVSLGIATFLVWWIALR